jgi:hypothetical protein
MGTIRGQGRGIELPAALSNIAASALDDFARAIAIERPQSGAMLTGPVAGIVGLTEPTRVRKSRLNEEQSEREEHAGAQLFHGRPPFAVPPEIGIAGGLGSGDGGGLP